MLARVRLSSMGRGSVVLPEVRERVQRRHVRPLPEGRTDRQFWGAVVTREEFEAWYASDVDGGWDVLAPFIEAVPCHCGEGFCRGWSTRARSHLAQSLADMAVFAATGGLLALAVWFHL